MKQFSNIATACGVERHIRLNEGMTTSAQIRVLAENNAEVYGQSDLFNFFYSRDFKACNVFRKPFRRTP